jgi:hypothetical protein
MATSLKQADKIHFQDQRRYCVDLDQLLSPHRGFENGHAY